MTSKRNIRFNTYLCLLVSILFSSCVSQKKISYFQIKSPEHDLQELELHYPYISKIQSGDILSILVSSLSPEASSMFNPYLNSNLVTASQTIQSNAYSSATGYLVNEKGFVTMPFLGNLNLSGLSTSEASTLITQKLNTYLEQPTVNIRILNFKISVLGEVARPSVYTIPNEQITLTEAVAMAGDLTIFGQRNNVLLIRTVDNKRVFSRIDLTKRDLFNSPDFYLKANDVIYVEPSKSKVKSSDRTLQLAPVIISGLSLITVLITSLSR
jgi:polysaccharide export outer membrane protein